MKPLNQSIKLSRLKWKSILLYIVTFLIPFLLLFTMHLLYNSGFGNPIVYTLTLKQIFFNGLASICFLFYIRHTDTICISDHGWQLIFSCAYGLCSYGIIQEGSISTLCVYAIFPVVFLSFEKMIDGLYYLPFLLSEALILIIRPSLGLSVFLFLIILTFLETGLKGCLSLGSLFHYLGCFTLSFLLAAFRVFPYFESIYDGSSSYNGYSISCSPFVFLSRFLPGSSPSISFFGPNGIDLYFGLFFFLSCILFFFSGTISGKKRLFYGCFTLMLVASLWLSPVRFIFHFFTESTVLSVPYSFLLVFWGLKLSMEAIYSLQSIPTNTIILSTLFSICMLLICYLGGSHNFHTFMLPIIIVLFLLQSAFLFRKKHKSFLFFLILLEFFCNAFFITNLELIPTTRSTQASFPWDKETEAMQKEENITTTEEEDAYKEFISSHVNTETFELLSSLMNSVPMEDTEKESFCGTALPDLFQLFNGLYKKIGGKGDLFSPFDTTFHFEASEDYEVLKLSGNIYHFYIKDSSTEKDFYNIPFSMHSDSPLPKNLYLYDNFSESLLQLTSTSQQSNNLSGYLRFSSTNNWLINFQISTYVLNEEPAKQLSVLVDSYLAQNSDDSKLYIFSYAGLTASCIGILILLALYMNSDKDKVYQALRSIKNRLDLWNVPGLVTAHLKKNRVYYLSFFIPFLLFIANMILTDCVPFGNDSIFDEDGFALTLPSALDTYYSMKDGNTYLSMNGGYGASLYARKPLVQLSSYYRLFSPGQIAPLLMFMEAFCLGLCGVTMTFFMTHRLHGAHSHKEDYRLLVPAMIYALNSYMLAMHNYTSWYLTLFAFPLLITAMNYLIYKKKCLPYVLLLSYCIATDIYLGLYSCIFLVIYFFTCHFHSLKDFVKKGIRFGLCSLLSAGNCYFLIANVLQSTYDSNYRDNDASFPAFGLHTSFLEQWKKHMIFSPAPSISADNGLLNIYCGILTIVLVLLYFFAKKISIKEKLKKLLPIVFLYISFNGQVLSYLWCGFHYQAKVPNRFVFLLLFLIAELSYDGLRLIGKTSTRKYCLLTAALAGFFLICQFLSEGNTSLAWISTLVLCVIYFSIHLLVAHFKKQSIYPKLLVLLLVAELSVNMIYLSTTYNTGRIWLLSDYPVIATAIENNLKDETGYFRTCFPAKSLFNAGQIYHTGSSTLFNSYVSKHQCILNMLYGFSSGSTNAIIANYQGTPFGLSLSNHRYLFLPSAAGVTVKDLERYQYLGNLEDYYVFENTSSLSLGIYAPLEINNLQYIFLWQFYNDLASLYTDTEASLFVPQTLEFTETENVSSGSFHIKKTDKTLTLEEIESVCAVAENDTSPALKLCLNYTPLISGSSYLYTDEFIPLGKTKAGVPFTEELLFKPNFSNFNESYDVVTMNEEVFNEFISKASKNQLENIEIGNDTITGSTNYEKDGYTMLSLACDRSWHAYIDGQEVEIEDPCSAFMLIKTPAGKHTLELKYIPYGMKIAKGISFAFWILTLFIFAIIHIMKRRKNASLS